MNNQFILGTKASNDFKFKTMDIIIIMIISITSSTEARTFIHSKNLWTKNRNLWCSTKSFMYDKQSSTFQSSKLVPTSFGPLQSLRGGSSYSNNNNGGGSGGYYGGDYRGDYEQPDDYENNSYYSERREDDYYYRGDQDDRYGRDDGGYRQDDYQDDYNAPRRSKKSRSSSSSSSSSSFSSNIPGIIKKPNRKLGFTFLASGSVITLLGISLFFNKTLLRLGNILYLVGVPLTIGPGRTMGYFLQPKKARATGCLGFGIFLVLAGYPVFGIALEVFGLLNLFGNMFPLVMMFLRNLPFVGDLIPDKKPKKKRPSYNDNYNDDGYGEYGGDDRRNEGASRYY